MEEKHFFQKYKINRENDKIEEMNKNNKLRGRAVSLNKCHRCCYTYTRMFSRNELANVYYFFVKNYNLCTLNMTTKLLRTGQSMRFAKIYSRQIKPHERATVANTFTHTNNKEGTFTILEIGMF